MQFTIKHRRLDNTSPRMNSTVPNGRAEVIDRVQNLCFGACTLRIIDELVRASNGELERIVEDDDGGIVVETKNNMNQIKR